MNSDEQSEPCTTGSENLAKARPAWKRTGTFIISNVMGGIKDLSPCFIDSSHFFHRDSAVAESLLAVDDECIVC